jgi:hypothetical protein
MQAINGIAPGGNLLSFLSAARDYELLGSEPASSPPPAEPRSTFR